MTTTGTSRLGGARTTAAAARRTALVFLCVTGFSCAPEAPSVLDPRGPAAGRIAGLWWLMLAIATGVFAVVVALIVAAVRRARTAEADPRRQARWGEPFIFGAGVVATSAILVTVFLISLGEMSGLARGGDGARQTIEIVAHDWWWEARYPNGAVTANEIHIPAGEPVRLRLLTADVIHSFWVPQLGPKVDMIPGRDNDMWLEASEPGRYRGQCAEFCGLQHANMIVYVVAQAQDDFDDWLGAQARPAVAPAGASAVRGRRYFEAGTCAGCHTVRGTAAGGTLGPDLTHLASRETIGAGVLPNNADALRRWITDPQGVKPGVTMPPVDVSRADLDDLIAYLEGLE